MFTKEPDPASRRERQVQRFSVCSSEKLSCGDKCGAGERAEKSRIVGERGGRTHLLQGGCLSWHEVRHLILIPSLKKLHWGPKAQYQRNPLKPWHPRPTGLGDDRQNPVRYILVCMSVSIDHTNQLSPIHGKNLRFPIEMLHPSKNRENKLQGAKNASLLCRGQKNAILLVS